MTQKQRQALLKIAFLTLLGMVFWSFDQQWGSSINLFILRHVARHGIPTAMFQSVNPFVIVFWGVFVVWLWRQIAPQKALHRPLIKMSLGFALLTTAFALLSYASHQAINIGKVNFMWPVAALALIGMAELFIDPVVLAQINKDIPGASQGLFTGMYYLFVGAIANYFAAHLAAMSSVATSGSVSPISSAVPYFHLFSGIAVVGLLLLFVCTFALYRSCR